MKRLALALALALSSSAAAADWSAGTAGDSFPSAHSNRADLGKQVYAQLHVIFNPEDNCAPSLHLANYTPGRPKQKSVTNEMDWPMTLSIDQRVVARWRSSMTITDNQILLLSNGLTSENLIELAAGNTAKLSIQLDDEHTWISFSLAGSKAAIGKAFLQCVAAQPQTVIP